MVSETSPSGMSDGGHNNTTWDLALFVIYNQGISQWLLLQDVWKLSKTVPALKYNYISDLVQQHLKCIDSLQPLGPVLFLRSQMKTPTQGSTDRLIFLLEWCRVFLYPSTKKQNQVLKQHLKKKLFTAVTVYQPYSTENSVWLNSEAAELRRRTSEFLSLWIHLILRLFLTHGGLMLHHWHNTVCDISVHTFWCCWFCRVLLWCVYVFFMFGLYLFAYGQKRKTPSIIIYIF